MPDLAAGDLRAAVESAAEVGDLSLFKMSWLLAIVILYLVLTNPQLLQGFGASLTTPAGTLQWPPQPGQPGYVTIGGQPAPAGYSLGSTGTAMQAAGYAQTGVALAGSAAAVGSLAPGASFGAIAGVSSALPIIGAAVGVIGLVVGIIGKHHAEMVAKEAAELNQALPLTYQRFVLILQATVRGAAGEQNEITSLGQAEPLIQQAIDDYYAIVKPMQQGTWHDPAPGWRASGPAQPTPKTPKGCNGPCFAGHQIEVIANALRHAIPVILNRGTLSEPSDFPNNPQWIWPAGFTLKDGHGYFTFLPQPSHAGVVGMGGIDVTL
jgi:hypothetical protein